MVLSQKLLRSKTKKQETGKELCSKNKKIIKKRSVKVSNEVKHVVNSAEKKTVKIKNLQKIKSKKGKASVLEVKLKNDEDKVNKAKGLKIIDTKETDKLIKSDAPKKQTIDKKKEQDASETPQRMKRKNPDVQNMRKRKRTTSETELESCTDFNVKDLSKKHILQCISAIFHLTQEQLKDKNVLLVEEGQSIFMQVTCIRVPKVPRRQMRILLPHSIILPHDEVALFVCDLERGRRKAYEPTIEHYKNLLNEHKCTRINEIIPMNRVRTEFDQFELKRKLIGSYDHFLVDGRIAGHMTHLLGKEFFKRRKLPTSIKMQSKDLKHEIDYALRKTSMHLHSNGDSHIMQVGNTCMKENEILENVLAACENLSKNYPGGWINIRSLRLKSATSLGLPFYMTLKNKNEIKLPKVQPKRPKAYHNVKGELSTYLGNISVTVKPEGDVILEKRNRKKSTNKDEDGKETGM